MWVGVGVMEEEKRDMQKSIAMPGPVFKAFRREEN
jgi:hypothetical protein